MFIILWCSFTKMCCPPVLSPCTYIFYAFDAMALFLTVHFWESTPQEAEMLRSISFHPSGDFLLVGTQHPTLRLYDVNTFQCFVSCNPLDQHTDTICSVNYNPSANSYVTCSKDGSIKLWDGVSNRCVTTFDKAHDGAEVCSAVFSKNSKYILSSGKDSVVKLWEISTGRTLVKYTGEDATWKHKAVMTNG